MIFLTDEKGRIAAHSDSSKVRTISPIQAWIQRLESDEKAFKEYDESGKYKIVYRVYDSNFNVNICITALTSDFINAIDMSELNKTMNNIKIGKTGYPFILTSTGNIVTHPDPDNFRPAGS